MNRNIISARGHHADTSFEHAALGSTPEQAPDSYADRLLKYIPAEVIGAYIAADAMLRSPAQPSLVLYWLVFGLGMILTPLYLWRIQKIQTLLQLTISTAAFAVWVFTLGGPFKLSFDWYNPLYGAILLPFFTLIVAIIQP